MNDDGSSLMHGTNGYNGITVRQHMALEITKAMIINPALYDRDTVLTNDPPPLAAFAVKVADSLLQALEGDDGEV